MDFTDKVVLITGAGAGIGRAAAIRFAQAGAKVVVNCLTPANAAQTLSMLPEAADGIAVCGDVSVKEETESASGLSSSRHSTVTIMARLMFL